MIYEYINQIARENISQMQIGCQIHEEDHFVMKKTKLFESEFGVCFI